MKTLLLLFLISTRSFLFAQTSPATEITKSTKIEKIDGIKYYLHTVEAGQTVYSIAKAYEVNAKDVIFENPEVVDGVSPGLVLKIPLKDVKKVTSVAVPPSVPAAPTFHTHTVEKQQTLYAISKLYNISIEEITKANPEIADGLKVGQQLKIPQKNTSNSAPPEKVIPPKSSATSEPTSVPEIKTNTDVTSSKTFSVSLLLPFNLDDIDTLKFQKNIRTAIPSKSYAAIEFYEGFLIAADSLKNTGLNLKISAFDAPNDSLQIVHLLEKSELRKSNLIIGPFHNSPSSQATDYAKRNHIPIVIPYAQQNKLLLGNKYAIKVSASTSTQVEAVADFITKHYKKQNLIVLHNGLLKEKSSLTTFKNRCNAELGKDSIAEVIFKTAGVKGLQAKLSATANNIIFIPSNDQAFVTSLVNSLRGLKKDFKIVLFGMESWVSFDNLDINTIQDLQLHIPSSSYLNYSTPETKEMMKKYREKYKTDPTKYALQGYDCGIYFLSELKKSGKDFYLGLPNSPKKGLQCNFQFVETAVESGYENKSVFILQYKDFTLSPEK